MFLSIRVFNYDNITASNSRMLVIDGVTKKESPSLIVGDILTLGILKVTS